MKSLSKSVFYLEEVDQEIQNVKEELDSRSLPQQYNSDSIGPNNLKPPGAADEDILDEITSFEERKKEFREVNLEKRKMVISELISTEKSYIHDLKMCLQTFMSDPKEGQSKGVDMEALFGNLEDIIQVSEKLNKQLEMVTVNKLPEEIIIGSSFQDVSESMKSVYGNYCASHEHVVNLMEKYQDDAAIQKYFSEKLEIIREQITCFNLSSLLIKPVQRILKYPLLLKELIKYTEEDHADKVELGKALQMMTALATSVNEFKRRKDLVDKYLKDADTSIASLLSRLSLHSVVKKSTRVGMRLSSSIGLMTLTKDDVFDEEEQKIRNLDKTIRTFLKDIKSFCMQLEEWVKVQFQTAEDIALFYMDECKCAEVDQYRTVHRELYSIILQDFKNFVNNRVVIPLAAVLQTFPGPIKLIEKRYDKLLDYDSSKFRLEKNKDVNKTSLLNEEYQLAKNTYEALNSQLIEELPKLFHVALSVVQDCVEDFAVARKRFIGRVMKQMLSLMELPSLKKINEDILENFQKAYVESCAELSLLSFIPKNLFPTKQEVVKDNVDKKQKSPQINRESKNQTESQRKLLQTNFPEQRLYIVTHQHQARDEFEVTVASGDIVGVIKEQDPMGKTDRWFIDNGIVKGFLPAVCLGKYQPQEKRVVPQINPISINTDSRPSSATWYAPKVTTSSGSEDSVASLVAVAKIIESQPVQDVNTQNAYSIVSDSETQEDRYDMPPDSPPHRYELPSDDLLSDDRYDIPPEENEELIKIDDTNSVPASGNATVSVQDLNFATPQDKSYYYATYDYSANTENELSLRVGQVVRVIHRQDMQGNNEWWFVQDRYGNGGFVPASYLHNC